jgi:hypothetical protein
MASSTSTPFSSGSQFRHVLAAAEADDGRIRIACDTEFQGPLTLTIQFAARLDDRLLVQLYRSPAVPEPPIRLPLNSLLSGADLCRRIILRPTKLITRWLSPVQVMMDLFQLNGITPLSRRMGDRELTTPAKAVRLILIGHFWTADLFRIFGRNFLAGLLRGDDSEASLSLQANKLLGFREVSPSLRYREPVVEYINLPQPARQIPRWRRLWE